MAISYNKTNAFYLIAGSLAAITLLVSVVLVVASDVPLLLILTLAILSALIIRFSYKIINDRTELTNLVKEKQELKRTIQDLESTIQGKEIELDDRHQRVKELGDKIKHHVQLSKDLADVKRELDSKRNKIQELLDIVNHKEIELTDAKKKIQDLENVVQDQETKLFASKKEMQDQKIDAEKRIQELEDIVKHKETEIINLTEKIKKASSTSQDLQNEVNALTGEKMLKNNEHQVEDEQRSRAQSLSMSEGVKKQETQRRNSFPFSSLSLLGSKKVSSSTHSLPQQ